MTVSYVNLKPKQDLFEVNNMEILDLKKKAVQLRKRTWELIYKVIQALIYHVLIS